MQKTCTVCYEQPHVPGVGPLVSNAHLYQYIHKSLNLGPSTGGQPGGNHIQGQPNLTMPQGGIPTQQSIDDPLGAEYLELLQDGKPEFL